MPDTRLILHVKGTQSETAELPKDVVRTAISEGKLTHSQLIWSPVNNAWKQVRELPELLPSEHLILHVKGTEAETKELPKKAIRAAISQGEITHSQLIWSAADNAWKQVRELPDLLPSQKLAPAPAPSRPAPASVPKAVKAVVPESSAGPTARVVGSPSVAAVPTATPQPRVASASATPRVAVASGETPKPAATSGSTPRVAVASAGAPRVAVAATPSVQTVASTSATGSMVVKEDEGSHPLKWVCIGLGILILLVLGINYLLVDQPLVSNLGQTPYSNVTVYAHFGAFMQPNVMVIHVPPSSKITPDNLTDFFVALAHSTPENPVTRDLFERVALTSGWTAAI